MNIQKAFSSLILIASLTPALSLAQGGGVNGVVMAAPFLSYIGNAQELRSGTALKHEIKPSFYTTPDGDIGFGQVILERPNVITSSQIVMDTPTVSILPSQPHRWTDLSGWSRPHRKVFNMEFKTASGRVLCNLSYRVTFISGGRLKGKGRYIAELNVAPENIHLKVDGKLNIQAAIHDLINFGTVEEPVVGLFLDVTIKFENSRFQTRVKRQTMLLDGNGKFEVIN